MIPDLEGLKQMQKGLQEATEEMGSNLASATATMKLSGSRVLYAGCQC